MKTLAIILLLTANVIGQDGLGTAKSNGLLPARIKHLLPEGIDGVTDIKKVQLLRVQALKDRMKVFKDKISLGSTSDIVQVARLINETQLELTLAQLDTTNVKQERLDYIQTALNSAIDFWRITVDYSRIGVDPSLEPLARAEVYKLRVMWLKEKASAEPLPVCHSAQ